MNISLPAFLDIFIGLVFIYLIISLLASEIQESLAGVLQWRAKHLKKSIYLMLSGKRIKKRKDDSIEDVYSQGELIDKLRKENIEQSSDAAVKLIDKIYNHYEIGSLEQSSLGFLSDSKNQYGASYIPPESFAEAFTDVILETIKNSSFDANLITDLESRSAFATPEVKSNIPEYTQFNLSRIAKKIKIRLNLTAKNSQVIEQQIRSEFIKEIATWFERSQERTSGTYKRNSKIVMFCIGLAAALLANANTFTIIENLHDEDVREAVVTEAVSSVVACQDKTGKELQTCLDEYVDNTLDINRLPIGWSNIDLNEDTIEELGENTLKNIVFVFENTVGYLVTALAVMMGAPFWFDLLKKFVNVRNAGVKPKPVETASTQENT